MKILLFDSGIGLLPSLSYLLKKKIHNDYYLEMESTLFPLGDKNEQILEQYIKNKIAMWEHEKYDRIYIICNTISAIIKKKNVKIPANMYLILDVNQKLLSLYKAAILATRITGSYMENLGYEFIDGTDLVKLIEEKNIELLIKKIKKLHFNNEIVILGCTHFSHIAFLLKRYHPKITFIDSYRSLFNNLKDNQKLQIIPDRKAKKYLSTFFMHNF